MSDTNRCRAKFEQKVATSLGKDSPQYKSYMSEYDSNSDFRHSANYGIPRELHTTNPAALKRVDDYYRSKGVTATSFARNTPSSNPRLLADPANEPTGVLGKVFSGQTFKSWANSASGYVNTAYDKLAAEQAKQASDQSVLGAPNPMPSSMGAFSPASVSSSFKYALGLSSLAPLNYGNYTALENAQELETAYTLDDVVMHCNRAPQKAVIKVYFAKDKSTANFPFFILRSFQLRTEQKMQLYEAFDTSFVYLFGEKPLVAEFTLSAYDMKNADWFRNFFTKYRSLFAGYQAATQQAITYIMVNDILFEGVMINLSPQKNIESNEIVHMGLTMVLTGINFLGSIGDDWSAKLRAQERSKTPADMEAAAQTAAMAANAAGDPSQLSDKPEGSIGLNVFTYKGLTDAAKTLMASARNSLMPTSPVGANTACSSVVASGGWSALYSSVATTMPLNSHFGSLAYASTNIGTKTAKQMFS